MFEFLHENAFLKGSVPIVNHDKSMRITENTSDWLDTNACNGIPTFQSIVYVVVAGVKCLLALLTGLPDKFG